MARQREPLPRLNTNPALHMQQPMGMGFHAGQPMYSPALPTSLQQSFHPPFPINNSLQTPMQPSFGFPQPPPAPGRPTHHQGHASIAHLAAAGIHPPTGFPMTPLGGHFPRPSVMGMPGQASGNPFPGRNRRQLSIGGPPKAVLGGPARKLSPLPGPFANTPPPSVTVRVKKVNVNIPKETVPGEAGQPATRPPWARVPLSQSEVVDYEVAPVETSSAESFPPDDWRNHVPDTLEVFLPGKRAWEEMKQKAIEEKLEKLGVERGSGSNVPHIHAPHARAASISSPADPQLLLFKLNKLQLSQEAAATGYNSLTPSPNPPFGVLSSSPNRTSPRFITNRHGHTMSLANMPAPSFFDSTAPTSFDPFGSHVDTSISPPNNLDIRAPQGHVPISVSSLAPPALVSRPASRPDFIRGFGLDIPEEEEEEEEAQVRIDEERDAAPREGATEPEQDVRESMEPDGGNHQEETQAHDGTATVSQSRSHSRHVSKLSAALSIRSAGALEEGDGFEEHEDPMPPKVGEVDGEVEDMDIEDAIGEWTGSEDVCLETSDGEESIGEYSNPSDEEQARQERLERRMRRRASQQLDIPRRIPNFPRPPENTMVVSLQREDGIISNPSDEEDIERQGDFLGVDYYSRPPSIISGTSRPLPPLPHSRVGSGQHTIHDPANAHSRTPSDQIAKPNYHEQQSQPFTFAPRRDSLNPFAKPFVFGAPRESFSNVQTAPMAPLMTHTRLPSLGKPLNVAAPEFKPTGFTFRPPAGVPQMPVLALETPRPLPEVPSANASPFKVQGREKRQRRGSTASMEEGDSMTSFRFPPNPESPQSVRRPLDSNSHGHQLNPSAEPFTFAGFSAVATLPYVPKATDSPEPLPQKTSFEETLNDDTTVKTEDGDSQIEEFAFPSVSKPKRAPIPLDFKHPVSSNTVPAGLFKALVNSGDDRTRRTVRSRLSSREIYEHIQRPSMDDMVVPTISHKISRSRLVTDPGQRTTSPEDVFGSTRHTRRRSSLPDALHDDVISPVSEDHSNPVMDLTSQIELQRYEQRTEAMLGERLSELRTELKKDARGLHASTQNMISEIQSLFRTQLRDSAVRSLEDSQMDARGEMDFQLFKDIVEEGNKDLLNLLNNALRDLQQQVWQAQNSHGNSAEVTSVVEKIGNRTVNAVLEAISEHSARQEAIGRAVPARERDATVDQLMTVLTPVLSSLRSDPIDYEFLTDQLTQAVKPHISQLIDLASDKRETASLIVDRILPLLPGRQNPLDTDAITLQLITEVRRAIAPIDAFEIKEQVADLVVERLNSRLAVRDKAFNIDSLSAKVTESVSRLLEPMQGVTTSIEDIASVQGTLSAQQDKIVHEHERLVEMMSDIQFNEKLKALEANQTEMLLKLQRPTTTSEPEKTLLVKDVVEDFASNQKTLADDLRSAYENINIKLNDLPSVLSAATTVLQNSHAEYLTSIETSKREMEDLRRLNTDYQIQLAKARGAHGQVRVEKENISEKLIAVEADRDRIRGQLKDLQTANAGKTGEIVSLQSRNSELEEALAQALARLKTSDVATQASQQRIEELEKINHEISSEKQSLKSKVDSLDLQVTFATRDKDSALQSLESLQKQHDHLSSQQTHWDDLRQASEKIEMLTTLIGQADNEELQELRRHRDRGKVLEGEHAALQKRFKEQETKVVNSERAALAARQSLAQAQQRSSEWERRAKDFEGQLDLTQTKLDQAEQTQTQLDADYSLVRLQLEEREANDRLAQDQQNKQREQISLLESKVARLQSELEQTKTAKIVAAPSPYRNITNGNTHTLPRPDSRASTIYDHRSATPQMRLHSQTSSARSDTPPQPSVWDSMHAPTTDTYKQPTPRLQNGRYPNLGPTTPKARRPPQYYRPTMPSPTPSTVSLAPTQGEDGWWS